MGNTLSSLAGSTQQSVDRKGSEPIVPTNVHDTVNTKAVQIAYKDFSDTTKRMIRDAAVGGRIDPTKQGTTQTKSERNQRVHKRKRKRPGQSRTKRGFLPKSFDYLPLDLKKSMRKSFKMYASHSPHVSQQDAAAAPPPGSEEPMTQAPAYTFVVKETWPVQAGSKISKRRPQVAIHPEVISTHPTAWKANLAVLNLLHEYCGRAGWDLQKCCMCGSSQRDYTYWWIDDKDGCLKAGFARMDAIPDEEDDAKFQESGDEIEELQWRGWVVERIEVGN